MKIFENNEKQDEFLSQKILEHEISYKNYRKLFESIKQRAKSPYYAKMILHYKSNIQKNLVNYRRSDWQW